MISGGKYFASTVSPHFLDVESRSRVHSLARPWLFILTAFARSRSVFKDGGVGVRLIVTNRFNTGRSPVGIVHGGRHDIANPIFAELVRKLSKKHLTSSRTFSVCALGGQVNSSRLIRRNQR